MVIITKSELKKIRGIERIIQQEFDAKKIPNAEEICEIQLYHLASKIKNTEVNEEVEGYLPAVMDVLEGLDREDLIKRMVSVEFGRFANYYSKTQDLNQPSGSNSDTSSNDGSTRYFINVGSKDGYDWKTLKDFLRTQTGLERDDIYRVDVKESFSFFNSDSTHSDEILQLFSEFKMDGRFINVEISSNSGGGSRGGGSRGGNRGGSRGGFRDRDQSKSKGHFSGKRRSSGGNKSFGSNSSAPKKKGHRKGAKPKW
jgi:ATP-dependent RNA helicase DeaD